MLVILSGVAGAGKNTIQKELIKRMENVIAIPSYTDREEDQEMYQAKHIILYQQKNLKE